MAYTYGDNEACQHASQHFCLKGKLFLYLTAQFDPKESSLSLSMILQVICILHHEFCKSKVWEEKKEVVSGVLSTPFSFFPFSRTALHTQTSNQSTMGQAKKRNCKHADASQTSYFPFWKVTCNF
jgi:hypothetical protein